MTTYREQLEVIDTITLNGNSQRGDCPFCGGRNTFSMRRDFDKTYWKCFKASCDASGSKRGKVSTSELKSRMDRKPEPRVQPVNPIPKLVKPAHLVPEAKQYLKECGLSDYKQARYCIKDNRVLFTHGAAAIGRSLGHGPKWKKYGDPNEIWDYGTCTGTVYLVEDVPSAIRLNQAGAYAISLCGTLLTVNYINFICTLLYDMLYIMLDADATATAINMSKQLRNSKIVQLRRDIKDMTVDEIREKLSETENISSL